MSEGSRMPRDPSAVPVTFVDSAEGVVVLRRLADAVRVSLDTETVFDPANPTDLDVDGPGAWRVTSVAARFADGSEEAFVVDMGHVPASALQRLFAEVRLARLRRFAAGSPVPAVVSELLELGDADALAVLLDGPSGELRFELDGLDGPVGNEAFAWNANFDRLVLSRDGVDAVSLRDAMLYQAVLDLGRAGVRFYTGLAKVARRLLGVDLDGKGSTQLSYRDVSDEPTLSAEQIRYAAVDAVVTLWVADRLTVEVEDAGLVDTVELEVAAQRFISNLTRFGLPLDVDGWREHLAASETGRLAVEERLAKLTGASTNLFGELDLGWSVSKDADIRRVLNAYAADEVRAFFTSKEGSARLFGSDDSVDKTVLAQIGGDVASAILEWKKLEKVRSTYGDDLVAMVDGAGRLHPKYLQAVVATGRLASSSPNAQNLSPQMKPFIRPPAGRVFVYADLGQAELRMLAQVSGDEVLTRAFIDGADIHVTTAEGMFKVDVAALIAAHTASDDTLVDLAGQVTSRGLLALTGESDDGTLTVAGRRYRREVLADQLAKYGAGLRARGKTLNFAVVYGVRANSLATQLTVAKVPTDRAEAQRLLGLYDQAYPGIARWLRERDDFVDALAASPPAFDVDRSFTLWRLHGPVSRAASKLRRQLGRTPDGFEIAEEIGERSRIAAEVGDGPGTEGRIAERLAEVVAELTWVASFPAAVLVDADGNAVTFESRTPGGRRRLFNVTAASWVKQMAFTAIRSDKPTPVALRREFETSHGVSFTDERGRTVSFALLNKRLTDTVAAAYVRMVFERMPDAVAWLAAKGAGEAIRSLGNQYRNAPIQGGVADAALAAYATIQRHLDAFFPTAFGVQTVHDSITIECDRADADAVGRMVKDAMEAGLARYCPDVPAVADLKVLSCLDEKVGAVDLTVPEPLAA